VEVNQTLVFRLLYTATTARTFHAKIRVPVMPALPNARHEALAQALARGLSAAAAYVEAGYKANRHNAAALAREKHIRTRVNKLHEEQLAIHQQATAEAAASAKVTIESLIQEAEAARAKAMSEKGLLL
jgi:hypothetical protein